MTTKRKFNFELGFSRAYKDTEGKMHIVGVASDTAPDLQGDRMSKKALDDMASQLEDGVDLLDSHRSTFGFGKTIGGVVTKNGNEYELVIDAELDDRYPQSMELYRCVENGTCDKQMSIGGEIDMNARDAITFEERNDGSFVRVINNITLDHIATTRKDRAANPRTKFMQAIIKDIVGSGDDEVTPEKFNFSKELTEKSNNSELIDASNRIENDHSCNIDDYAPVIDANNNVAEDPSFELPDNFPTEIDASNNVAKDATHSLPETTPKETTESESTEDPIEKGACPHCGTKCSPSLMKKDDWACQNCFGTMEEWELHKDSSKDTQIPFKSFPLIERDSEDDTVVTKADLQTLEKNVEWFKDSHVFFVVGKDKAAPIDSSAFHLAHHKLHNDQVQTTFKGVVSGIVSIIKSSFNKVEIDENTRSLSFAHLSRHIREFGLKSPTIKEFLAFKEVDQFVIWMARVNNIDISFAKNLHDEVDLGCFGGSTEKTTGTSKREDDIQYSLSFFANVGRDLRTEKNDNIDPVLSAFAPDKPTSEKTKTEKENVDMAGKNKETTKDEPLVLGKDANAETIFKGMDWIMGNVRNVNLAQQPDLAEKMRTYFSSFQQLLAQEGILKKDNIDEVPSTESTQETTPEETTTNTETETPADSQDTSDSVTEKSVQAIVEQASPMIAQQLAILMKDSFTPEAILKAYEEIIAKNVEKSVTNGVNSLQEKLETISKDTNARLGKVEKVSGTKQSVPENGGATDVTKDRKPTADNPFKSFWDAPINKALATMGKQPTK